MQITLSISPCLQFIPDPWFEEVKAFVRSGVFGPCNYKELMGSLEGNEGYGRADYFLIGKDLPSYTECREKLARTISAVTDRFMNVQETYGGSNLFYCLELVSGRWGM
ncbi:hypothetical protein SADUNF_Sadunf08G0075300 [Salix dunnii]|uniref:Uncharacterized protein n=1 Tax=Salix dunnii TaxID=1413687 RepID=A0A835JYG1_9ROSI|nr:hypothetical protein SADUNF_Sadunf08G0075300 [Salix dunnii]